MKDTDNLLDRKTVEQIKRLDFSLFEEMEPHNVRRLTHGFDERYCLLVVCRETTNLWQRRYCEKLRKAYIEYKKEEDKNTEKRPFLRVLDNWYDKYYQCPAFMDEWSYELSLGGVLTTDGISVSDDTDTSGLEARIKELQARIEELQTHIKELEEENAELLAALQEPAEDIKWHDKVRLDFVLRLLEKDGANIKKYGNKIKAALVMQTITGLSLATCRNYCTNRDLSLTHHEEEILKLNSTLQSLCMEIRL